MPPWESNPQSLGFEAKEHLRNRMRNKHNKLPKSCMSGTLLRLRFILNHGHKDCSSLIPLIFRHS